MSRSMIAALQVSLDGFIQGENIDEGTWVDSWPDALDLIPDVDALVQGAGMQPDYGDYWGSIEADPTRETPFQNRRPTDREIAYARFAGKTPHYVVSTKLTSVAWPPTAQIVRDFSALRALKAQPGKNIYVVGGALLVANLINEGLLDELRLIVHPLLLGGGKALFAGVHKRRALEFAGAAPTRAGRVILTYRA